MSIGEKMSVRKNAVEFLRKDGGFYSVSEMCEKFGTDRRLMNDALVKAVEVGDISRMQSNTWRYGVELPAITAFNKAMREMKCTVSAT